MVESGADVGDAGFCFRPFEARAEEIGARRFTAVELSEVIGEFEGIGQHGREFGSRIRFSRETRMIRARGSSVFKTLNDDSIAIP